MDLLIASSSAAPSPAASGPAAGARPGAGSAQQDAGAPAEDSPFQAVLAQQLGLAAEGKAPQGRTARAGAAASAAAVKADEDAAQAAAAGNAAAAANGTVIPFPAALAAAEPAPSASMQDAGTAAAGAGVPASTAKPVPEGAARVAAALRLQQRQQPERALAAAIARTDTPVAPNAADFAAAGNSMSAPAAHIPRETTNAIGAAEPSTDAAPVLAAGSNGNAAPAQPAVPPPAPALSARVGEHGWDQALGDRLLWMAGQGQQVAQLHLNPPELGPLHVTLTLNHDQASAQFISGHALVRDALEAGMPRLREMLADSGIALGNASVSADAFREQTQPEAQQQPRSYAPPPGAAMDSPGIDRSGTLPLRALRGLVDTFA